MFPASNIVSHSAFNSIILLSFFSGSALMAFRPTNSPFVSFIAADRRVVINTSISGYALNGYRRSCHFELVERSSSARLLPEGRKKSPSLRASAAHSLGYRLASTRPAGLVLQRSAPPLSYFFTSGPLSRAPLLSLPSPLHVPCNELQEITQFSRKNPLLGLSPVAELRRNSCGYAAHLSRFFTSISCYVYHSCSIHGVFMVCSYPHNTKITQFCQNFALSRSRPSGSAARALVLLEKEGVHLIHGQSATGYDTLLHLGEVGLVEQTAVLHVIHHERLQLGLDGLCTGRQPTPRRPDRPRDRPLGIPKGDACRSALPLLPSEATKRRFSSTARTEGAARAMPNAFEHCRVASEEGHRPRGKSTNGTQEGIDPWLRPAPCAMLEAAHVDVNFVFLLRTSVMFKRA